MARKPTVNQPAKQEPARRPKGWQKGQSGNPRGRPKGPTITTVLREALEAGYSLAVDGSKVANPRGIKNRDLLVHAMIREALDGNAPIVREILERIDGKADAGAARRDIREVHVLIDTYRDPDEPGGGERDGTG